MADVFVSYASRDAEIARYVARGLKQADYDVWDYQQDGQTPGADYLDNIGEGVRQARVVVLFVSPSSVVSPQCNSEAQIAWEESKEVIPLLCGITFEQLKSDKKGKRWADRIGTKVSIQIDGRDPQQVLEAVLAGLQATRRTTAAAPRRSDRPPVKSAGSVSGQRIPSAGAAIAGAVGALGLIYCLFSMSRVFSPPPGPEAWLAKNFPTVKLANVLVNLLGLAQNAALLYGAWRLKQSDAAAAVLIRRVALSMLVTVGVWALVVLLHFTGARAAALIPDPAGRSAVINGTLFLAMVALVPSALVFWVFRKAGK